MGIVSWLVLGAIAGYLANMLAGGREGILGTLVLGIVGAIVGGFISAAVLGRDVVTGLTIESVVAAVIGAVIVLALVRAASRKRLAL